jgi:hypothetical protein
VAPANGATLDIEMPGSCGITDAFYASVEQRDHPGPRQAGPGGRAERARRVAAASTRREFGARCLAEAPAAVLRRSWCRGGGHYSEVSARG